MTFKVGEFYKTRSGVECIVTDTYCHELQLFDADGFPLFARGLKGVICASGAPCSWDDQGKYLDRGAHAFDLVGTT